MAISVLTVKGISFSQGRSACAAAAYRAGEKIQSDYTGQTYDYTNKGNVVYSEIILPEGTPQKYKDRSTLWNEVEYLTGKSRNGRKLATEIMAALPRELTLDQDVALCHEYCRYLASHGIVCDMNIHNPPMHDDLSRPIREDGSLAKDPSEYVYNNPHVHIMLTVRTLGKDGFESRTKGAYVCQNAAGETRVMLQEEIAASGGVWQKRYSFRSHEGSALWMTKKEGRAQGYEQVSKYPQKLMHGITAGNADYVNGDGFVQDVRQQWEQLANKALEKAGYKERIDMRSYADQAKNSRSPDLHKIPQQHAGPRATHMDRAAERHWCEGDHSKAVFSDIYQINKEIRQHNHMIDVYLREQKDIDVIKDAVEKYSRQLAVYKKQWISAMCHSLALEKEFTVLDQHTDVLRQKVDGYQQSVSAIHANMERIRAEAEDIKEELANPVINRMDIKSRKRLEQKQHDLEQQIQMGQHLLDDILHRYGYTSTADVEKDISALWQAEHLLDPQKSMLTNAKKEEQSAKQSYMAARKTTPKNVKKYIQEPKITITRAEAEAQYGAALADAIMGVAASATEMIEREIEEEEYQEDQAR